MKSVAFSSVTGGQGNLKLACEGLVLAPPSYVHLHGQFCDACLQKTLNVALQCSDVQSRACLQISFTHVGRTWLGVESACEGLVRMGRPCSVERVHL